MYKKLILLLWVLTLTSIETIAQKRVSGKQNNTGLDDVNAVLDQKAGLSTNNNFTGTNTFLNTISLKNSSTTNFISFTPYFTTTNNLSKIIFRVNGANGTGGQLLENAITIDPSYSDASVKVGINTSSPTTTFETFSTLSNAIQITGTGQTDGIGYTINNTTATTGKSYNILSKNTGEFVIRSVSGGNTDYFLINSSSNVLINSSGGNVGIGSTSNPDARLNVFSTANNGTNVGIKLSGGNGTSGSGVSILFNPLEAFPSWKAAEIAGVFGGGGYLGNLIFRTQTQSNSGLEDRLIIQGQGGIIINNGASTSSAPALAINSTVSGFLPPRMTNTQKAAISSPVQGLVIFCTDCTATDASTGVLQCYNGSTWKNAW